MEDLRASSIYPDQLPKPSVCYYTPHIKRMVNTSGVLLRACSNSNLQQIKKEMNTLFVSQQLNIPFREFHIVWWNWKVNYSATDLWNDEGYNRVHRNDQWCSCHKHGYHSVLLVWCVMKNIKKIQRVAYPFSWKGNHMTYWVQTSRQTRCCWSHLLENVDLSVHKRYLAGTLTVHERS